MTEPGTGDRAWYRYRIVLVVPLPVPVPVRNIVMVGFYPAPMMRTENSEKYERYLFRNVEGVTLRP